MKTEKIHLLSLCSVFAIVAHHLEVKNLLVSLKLHPSFFEKSKLYLFPYNFVWFLKEHTKISKFPLHK